MSRFYRALIIATAGCTEAEAEHVEQLMRDDNGGTLDHLARARFASAARSAFKMLKNTPSPEQLAAIRRFAKRHGRTWKAALNAAWMRAAYDFAARENDDAALLQQVRNSFGPSWLVNFQLKEIA